MPNSTITRAMLAAFFPLLVGGCLSVQTIDHEVWSHISSAKEVSRASNKAAAPAARRLTLEEIMAHALEHAPMLRLARERAGLGNAEVEAARPIFPDNPTVTSSLGGRITGGSQFLEMAFGLEQRLEIAGERRLRRRAALRYQEALGSEVELLRWTLQQEIRCAFYRSLLAKERLMAAERLMEFSQEVLTITQRQVDADDIAPISLLLAQAEYAQARQALRAAEESLRSATLTLVEMIGWPPDQPFEAVGEFCPVRRAPPLEQLVTKALERHPSIISREQALAAAEAQVSLADREAWPEPSLGVTYIREGDPSNPPHIWLVSLGLPLPLWQRNQGDRARSRAHLAVAQTDLEVHRSTIHTRLARASSAVDTAADRVEIFGTDIVPNLERNLTQIRRAYDLGEMDVHQVSQIRQRVIETESAALTALEDYFRAAADLQTHVGEEVWTEEPRQEASP